MTNVKKLSVSLSSDLAEMVREAVAGGGYTSSSEVIREALRDWKVKQSVQAVELERLRTAWAQGVEDLDSGRYTQIDTADDLKAVTSDIEKRGLDQLATHRSD